MTGVINVRELPTPLASAPPELIVSGVVTGDDTVDVRLYNPTEALLTFPASRVTVSVGGGPDGGAPQPPPST